MPVEKKIAAIRLGQPTTLNPQLFTPIKIQVTIKIESVDMTSPNPIAIFSGRSEKAKIISAANLKRFCNV